MELPIFSATGTILGSVDKNPVTIVVGETGCGKTTRIPQLLYAAGYADHGMIGVTEPRRIAAVSVAKFVGDAIGSRCRRIERYVSYHVRYTDKTTDATRIAFMTDGILLREFQSDPDLSRYSVIMVDEAHERSRNLDLLFGLLKGLIARRSDMRVVIASATIDHEKISGYFRNAPVICVAGRLFPVAVEWSPVEIGGEDMTDALVEKVLHIHRNSEPGDILVFAAGVADIREVVDGIERYGCPDLVALPLHALLPTSAQQRIFENYPDRRKVVIATNIAETSVTIEGIRYVVDSGLVKQVQFNYEIGVEGLVTVPHSQAGCEQRKGRAGRVASGVCYRMFTQDSFAGRPRFTEPEIKRTSPAGLLLTLKGLGIGDAEQFDFIDPPSREACKESYAMLEALGAVEGKTHELTYAGAIMAQLPLDPAVARMVLVAQRYGCVKQIATIAAMLTARNIFVTPEGFSREATRANKTFKDRRSDMLTLLRVWEAYEDEHFSILWTREHFLNLHELMELSRVRKQMLRMLERGGVAMTDSGADDTVLKAVAAGLAYRLFRRGRTAYHGVLRTVTADIHPASALRHSRPEWLVAAGLLYTSKVFAVCCSGVEVAWLPEMFPDRATFGNASCATLLPGGEHAAVQQEVFLDGVSVGSVAREVPLADVPPECRPHNACACK